MTRCPIPGCGNPSVPGSVCAACLVKEQMAPGTLAGIVDRKARVLRFRHLSRSLGVLALVVLFLYVVLFGAVKVIKLAGG